MSQRYFEVFGGLRIIVGGSDRVSGHGALAELYSVGTYKYFECGEQPDPGTDILEKPAPGPTDTCFRPGLSAPHIAACHPCHLPIRKSFPPRRPSIRLPDHHRQYIGYRRLVSDMEISRDLFEDGGRYISSIASTGLA